MLCSFTADAPPWTKLTSSAFLSTGNSVENRLP